MVSTEKLAFIFRLWSVKEYRHKEDEMGGAFKSHGTDDILAVKPEQMRHLEDLGVDRKIILDWIFGKFWLYACGSE
jgi:hypothetical protein